MYPAILEFGSFAVSSLWFFVAIGFLVTGITFIKLAIRNKLKIAFLTKHFFGILVYGLIGARIVFILTNWQEYFAEGYNFSSLLHIFYFWDKGLNFWGGVIGIIYAIYKYTKKEQEPFLKWLDALGLSLLAGIFFGNIGAFLEGINYGNETSLPWGVTYQNFMVPYTIPVHPSQIYSAITAAALFTIFLLLFLKEKIQQEGIIFFAIMCSYGFLYFLEAFTLGEEVELILELRQEQWIAIATMIFAGAVLFIRYNKTRHANP